MFIMKLHLLGFACLIACVAHHGLVMIEAQSTTSSTTEIPVPNKSLGLTSKARISLESNSLDLSDSSLVAQSAIRNQTAADGSIKKPKRKRKERENRRLSNIWSLFLPSQSDASASETDYDENTDGNEDGTSTVKSSSPYGDLERPIVKDQPTSDRNKTDAALSSGVALKDEHNERIVAKYSRPPRQDSDFISSETLMASSSTASSSGRVPISNSSETVRSKSNLNEPVQLITGSLSKDLAGSNMNFDMMTNTMTVTNHNEVEHEGENQRSTQPSGTSNSSGLESSNFDRWLSRIQAKDQLQLSTLAPSRVLTEKPESSTSFGTTRATTVRPTTSTMNQQDILKMMELLNDLKLKQQHAGKSSSRSKPFSSLRTNPDLEQHKIQVPSISRISTSRIRNPGHQLIGRQQNSQLIHGINSPAAQASTISVSTQDGSSNTSLSFAMMDQMQAGPNAETSQVENSTSTTPTSSTSISGGSKEEGGQVEQSIYQSQDEILRQVTNAINFEQQLAREPVDVEQSLNHRKPGETANPPTVNVDDAAIENMSKLFKAGSGISELTGPHPVPAKPLTANNTNLIGPGEVDRNLESLADKLRSMAQQQSLINSNGSSHPSWILPKPLVSGASALGNEMNLTKLTASAAARNQSVTNGNLEKLGELLNKLEKSKNELKNSQETMAMLMKQLMQQQHQKANKYPPANLQADKSSPESQTESSVDQEDVTLNQQVEGARPDLAQPVPGWMPLNKPSSAPMSPGKIVKSKFRQPPMGVSQEPDNVGIGKDAAGNDEYLMNNLALMFASSAAAQQADQNANQISIDPQVSQRIIGLPIAIMKEDELELQPGQLDTSSIEAAAAAAAEQLSGGPRGAPMRQFTPRLAPTGINQVPLRFPDREQQMFGLANRPGQLDQIQKLLQNYSPQTFTSSGHAVTPRAPFIGGADSPANQHNGLQQLAAINNDQIASLAPSTSGTDRTESGIFKGHLVTPLVKDVERQEGSAGPIQESAALQGDPHSLDSSSSGALRKDLVEQKNQAHIPNVPNTYHHPVEQHEFQMQKQAQQQVQPHLAFAPQARTPGSAYVQTTSTVEYPMRPNVVHGMSPMIPPHPHYDGPPMITTTSISGGGPPVRIREISLPRPFGFRGNHAIAYQPSPVVAAMFPKLVGNSNPRPSIFRHMSPLRAGFSESQRLLRPLLGSSDGPRSPMLNHHFYSHSGLGNVPMSLPIQHTYIQRLSGGLNERRGQPGRLKRLMMSPAEASEDWQMSKIIARSPSRYSPSKTMRAIQTEQEQLETIDLPVADAELLNDDDDDADHTISFTEDIKYLPMDSTRDTTVRQLTDIEYQALMNKPRGSLVKSNKTPMRPPTNEQQPKRNPTDHHHHGTLTTSSGQLVSALSKTNTICNHPSLAIDKPSTWPNSLVSSRNAKAEETALNVQSGLQTTKQPSLKNVINVTSSEQIEQNATTNSAPTPIKV